METQTPSMSLRDRFGILLRDNRLVIAIEVILLILLVAFRLQSRTIFLLLLGWLSLWLRRKGWKNIGMNQPSNWWRTILAGFSISAIYQLFSIGIVVPVLHRLTNTTLDLSQFDSLRGDFATLAIWLIVSWTIAAFGEEIVLVSRLSNISPDEFRTPKHDRRERMPIRQVCNTALTSTHSVKKWHIVVMCSIGWLIYLAKINLVGELVLLSVLSFLVWVIFIKA